VKLSASTTVTLKVPLKSVGVAPLMVTVCPLTNPCAVDVARAVVLGVAAVTVVPVFAPCAAGNT